MGGGIPSIACDNDTINRLSVTFTASDECANTILQTARFIVVDTLAPTIVSPVQDTVVYCDGSDGLLSLQEWIDNNGGASATEGCGGPVNWTHDYTGGGIPSVGVCDNDTTNRLTVTFTASDECANTILQTARFIIVDTLPPALTLPSMDTIVNCDGLGNLVDLQSWLDNNGGASAAELCGNSISYSHDYLGGGVPSVGVCNNDTTNILSVTFSASDACNNTVESTSRFIIVDTITPQITSLPLDTIVQCDGAGNTTDLNDWLINNGGAQVTDACSSGADFTWTNDYTGGSLPSLTPCTNDTSNILTVQFTVSDACDNTETAVARFIAVSYTHLTLPTIYSV